MSADPRRVGFPTPSDRPHSISYELWINFTLLAIGGPVKPQSPEGRWGEGHGLTRRRFEMVRTGMDAVALS